MKELSRQQRWQNKKRASGLCAQCGKPANNVTLCPECSIKRRVEHRKANGYKEKTKEGR